ncbi:hypothetical protein [Brachybacterium hainanense]|uniref:Uncharacterized protein n=1 Tax=Brachybacterium hainanense TaxID=1541174 RepID=A0ABV6RCW3_9MICO
MRRVGVRELVITGGSAAQVYDRLFRQEPAVTEAFVQEEAARVASVMLL